MTEKELCLATLRKLENKYYSRDIKKIISIAIDVIVDFLSKGQPIRIRRLGNFRISIRKKRKGFNISNGKEMELTQTKMIHFRPSKKIKQKLNKEKLRKEKEIDL